MTDPERKARIQQVLLAEQSNPEGWWWLSFASASDKFLGACLVRARGPATAAREAHLHNCNPGGEVCSIRASSDFVPHDGWANRLLSRPECEMFDRVHAKRKN